MPRLLSILEKSCSIYCYRGKPSWESCVNCFYTIFHNIQTQDQIMFQCVFVTTPMHSQSFSPQQTDSEKLAEVNIASFRQSCFIFHGGGFFVSKNNKQYFVFHLLTQQAKKSMHATIFPVHRLPFLFAKKLLK